MTQLSREEAVALLTTAGCPMTPVTSIAGPQVRAAVLLAGIGCAESDLTVAARSPQNKDGSYDNGIWQVNDKAWPTFSPTRLREDPQYCAGAAVYIMNKQGFRSWYSYRLPSGVVGPYALKMPPGLGGPDLSLTTKPYSLVVQSWQMFLNSTGEFPEVLDTDGDYGPKTDGATVLWKRRHFNDGVRAVNARTWRAAGIL